MGLRSRMVAVVLLCSFAVSTLAQEYQITFNRPLREGMSFRVQSLRTSFVTSKTRANRGVFEAGQEKTAVEFTADLTVHAVNDQAAATKVHLRIRKCLVSQQRNKRSLVEPGMLIEGVMVAGEERYTSGGEPVDETLAEVLIGLGLLGADLGRHDDWYGSKTPQKAGDYWSLNKAAVARDMGLEESDVEGTVELQKVARYRGPLCMQLAVDLRINEVRDDEYLPEGYNVESGSQRWTSEYLLPVDPQSWPLRVNTRANMRAIAHKPENEEDPALTLVVESTYSDKTTYTLLKEKVVIPSPVNASDLFTGFARDLVVPVDHLEGRWSMEPSAEVDDLASMAVPSEAEEEVEGLAELVSTIQSEMSPLGLRSWANYQYEEKQGDQLSQHDLYIMIFKDTASCEQFWRSKLRNASDNTFNPLTVGKAGVQAVGDFGVRTRFHRGNVYVKVMSLCNGGTSSAFGALLTTLDQRITENRSSSTQD